MEHRRSTVASCLRDRNIDVEESAPIGKGAYGKVFRGVLNKRAVAIKRMMYCAKATNGVPLASLREMAAGLHLCPDYPTLMRLLDWAQENHHTESSIYLVYEMMNCDMSTFMKNQTKFQDVASAKLSESLIQHLSGQLLKGIDYMHINRMVHRDIKPDNILIDRNLNLKIADFGLTHASGFEGSRTPEVVTLWYRAPEILVRSEYGSMCDVWAAGLIICEMSELRPLVVGNSEVDVIRNILRFVGKDDTFECPFTCWEDLVPTHDLPLVSNIRKRLSSRDEDFLALVIDLLSFNPDMRPTAYEALQRVFFKKKYPRGPPCRMVDRVIIQDEDTSESDRESEQSDCDSSATESCEPDHDTDTYHRYSSADDFEPHDDPDSPSSEEAYPTEADNVTDTWDGSDILYKLNPDDIASAVSSIPEDSEKEEPRMQFVRLSEEMMAHRNCVSDFTRSYPNALIAWNATPAPAPVSARQQRHSMPEPAAVPVLVPPAGFQAQVQPQRPVVSAMSEASRPSTFNRVPGAERVRDRAVPNRRLSMPANPTSELEPLLRRLDLPNDLAHIREEEEAPAQFSASVGEPQVLDNALLDIGSEVEIASSACRFSPFAAPPGHNVDLDASDSEEEAVAIRYDHFDPSASTPRFCAQEEKMPALTDLLPRFLAEDLQISAARQGAALSALPIIPNSAQRRSIDPSRKRLVQEPRCAELTRPPKARRSTPCLMMDVTDPFNIFRLDGSNSPGCNTNTSFGENTLRAALEECIEAVDPLAECVEPSATSDAHVKQWLKNTEDPKDPEDHTKPLE